MTITDEELDKIESRARATDFEPLQRIKNRNYETYGPFEYRIATDTVPSCGVGGADTIQLAELWVHARPDILCLVEEMRELREQLADSH